MAQPKFKPGDIVEVLHPLDILKTLDSNGTMDNLPFMPEMIHYCGKKFKVSSRIEKTCVECFNDHGEISDEVKEFLFNDVVFLEDLRCSGISHNSCQIGCMIFWKEAWLKKYNYKNVKSVVSKDEVDELKKKLKVKEDNKKYFCQSTQLGRATRNISNTQRFQKLFKETQSGQIKYSIAIKAIVKQKIRILRHSELIKGNLKDTPSDVLNLQPGEIVEIKSFDEIIKTLDMSGKNKGLRFYYDMKQYCGKKFKVRNRLERMILEGTGEMININNTVILDNVFCSFDYITFGCPRARFQIWREIWLKRVK